MAEPLRLYISWSHCAEDDPLHERLLAHLFAMGVDVDLIQREAGTEMDSPPGADIALLLISPDYLWRDAGSAELPVLLRSRDAGQLWTVPVLLRSVDIGSTPLAGLRLRPLPHNGKPIAEWRHGDRALADVVKGVRQVAAEIRLRRAPPPGPAAPAHARQTRVYVLSHQADRAMRERFVRHLTPYEMRGRIRLWHPGRLLPGESMDVEREELASADVVIPLLSADFIASAPLAGQLRTALDRQRQFDASIVPILVRPIAEMPAELGKFQCFPTHGKAISLWDEQDSGWSNLVQEIIGFIQPPSEIPVDPRQIPGWSARARFEDVRWVLRDILSQSERYVPGPPARLEAAKRMGIAAEYYEGNVADALEGTRRHQERSTRQVAEHVFFLRMAAGSRPVVSLPETPQQSPGVVDLRSLLPEIFGKLLRELIPWKFPNSAPTYARGASMAAAEPALLRILMRAMSRLPDPSEVTLHDQLDLTFYFAQVYLNEVPEDQAAFQKDLNAIDPGLLPPGEASRDLFDPFRFSHDRFDYRLASVLYSLGPVDLDPLLTGDSQPKPPASLSVTSSALEDMLVRLAALPLTEDDLELKRRRRGSCLGWDFSEPTNVPELALWCLLGLNMARFADLPQSARTAWLDRLGPDSAETPPVAMRLVPLLLQAGGEVAAALSSAERQLLRDRALMWIRPKSDIVPERSADSIEHNACYALIHLYGAGESSLLEELRRFFNRNLNQPAAISLLSYYLASLAHMAPEELAYEVLRLLLVAKRHDLEPHLIAGGLARAINSGTKDARERSRAVLRRLGRDPVYGGSPQLQELARRLGAL